jgi:transposase
VVSSTKRCSEREQFWRRLIRQHERSGDSIKAFCQSQGVSQPAYFAWRKKLALGKRTNTQPDFVAVQLAPNTPVPASGIEIVLNGGRRVRVEPGFDQQLLSDVLRVLEKRAC